ncbi:hypothetical protein V8E53_007959 [Lactarius tabidus]
MRIYESSAGSQHMDDCHGVPSHSSIHAPTSSRRGDPQVTSQPDRIDVIVQPVRPFLDTSVRSSLRFTLRPPLARHDCVLLQKPIAKCPALSCTIRQPARLLNSEASLSPNSSGSSSYLAQALAVHFSDSRASCLGYLEYHPCCTILARGCSGWGVLQCRLPKIAVPPALPRTLPLLDVADIFDDIDTWSIFVPSRSTSTTGIGAELSPPRIRETHMSAYLAYDPVELIIDYATQPAPLLSSLPEYDSGDEESWPTEEKLRLRWSCLTIAMFTTAGAKTPTSPSPRNFGFTWALLRVACGLVRRAVADVGVRSELDHEESDAEGCLQAQTDLARAFLAVDSRGDFLVHDHDDVDSHA